MGKKAGTGKKVASAPLGGGASNRVKKDPKFESKKRSFRIGGDVLPKRDLTRFVKWPAYIRLQRQKRIMLQRLKVPPSIAQFQHTCDKNQFVQLARLCKKLAPETRAQKKERLAATAGAQAGGDDVKSGNKAVLKFGINHVSELVENNKAKLVVIAHDVDPVELVCWLPALCRKKDIPYVVVKGKSRLGQLVKKKSATCLAITAVKKEDHADLEKLCETFRAQFNDNKEVQRHWGGGVSGVKSLHVQRRRQAILEREQAKKTGLAI